MTACAVGVSGKGFPRRSGSFGRAVDTVEDVANSSLTSMLSMRGWSDRPTSSRRSGSTWRHLDWCLRSGSRSGGLPRLSD